MSFELVGDVMAARRAPWTHGKFTVLLVLASYANDDGSSIHPSIERLARACRMEVRGVQVCLKWLIADGVLKLEQKAFGRDTNLYKIDIDRVALFMGCKKCGGVICGDKGCKNLSNGVQKTARHIDTTLSRPFRTKRGVAPRAPERRGDPALWQTIAAALEPKQLARLEGFGAAPVAEDGRVVVDFAKAFMQRHVEGMRREVQAATGMPTVFRYAGREGQ